MTKQEKIQLLKDIATGKKNISDLKEKDLLVKIGYYNPETNEQETMFFIDGKQVTHNKFLEAHNLNKLDITFSYGHEE